MAKDDNLTDFLTDVADALRYVYGYNYDAEHLIDPQNFSDMIYGLSVPPTGNIQLTTSALTDVSNYATATVRSASTYTMTGSAVTDTVSLGTLSSGYYPVNAKVKGTISAGTAGWFSSSGAVQASTATQVGKIAAGTITNNTSGGTSSGTVNFGKEIKIGAGYYPSDSYYTAQSPSGNIQLTQSSSTNVASYATATVKGGSATPSATVSGSSSALSSTTAMNNQYFSVTPKATVGTAGWISSISNAAAVNYKVKDGSATTPATTITANPSAPTLNTSNNKYYVTVSKTQNVTPSVSAGWVSSGTAGTITVSGSTEITKGAITNNTSGGTSSGTVNFGKQLKVSAGWYPSDLYYTAQNPSGNIQLTTSSSTNVAAYATATVRSASSYSLAITDKSTTAPTMGSYSSGYYSITTSLTGTLTAGTSGWFSSGSATDSSVVVGRLPRVALTSSTTAPTGDTLVTVTPSTSTKYVYASTGGYFPTPASNAPRIAVSGDSNLIASNIKQGVSIFGVTGTYGSGGNGVIASYFQSQGTPLRSSGTLTLNGSLSDNLRLFFYTENPDTETSGIEVMATILDLSHNSSSKTYLGSVQVGDSIETSLTLTDFKGSPKLVTISFTTTGSGQDRLSMSLLEMGVSKTSNWGETFFAEHNVGELYGYFYLALIGILTADNKFVYEVYGDLGNG